MPDVARAQSELDLNGAKPQQLWVGAYVPGWNQEPIDPSHEHAFDAVTAFLHFGVYFRPHNGNLDLATNELTPEKMRELVLAAHNAHKQALLVVGGEGAARGLRVAANPAHLSNTLRGIISLVDRYGYDGIDVDWEPLAPKDAVLYSRFVDGLREGLDRLPANDRQTRRWLTTAIEVNLNDDDYMAPLLSTLHKLDEKFDRIDLMTYTMAIPSSLPFVWHNSALYPGISPKDGFRTPSADGAVKEFIAAGFQRQKLAIGIDLYGYLWQGRGPEDISVPGRTWKSRPKVTELSYGEVTKYLQDNSSHWDEEAKVPYLSFPLTNRFVSYEDGRGIEAKVAYSKENSLGGIIVWDVGRDDENPRAKRELLSILGRALISNQAKASEKSIQH
jgi:chitinase